MRPYLAGLLTVLLLLTALPTAWGARRRSPPAPGPTPPTAKPSPEDEATKAVDTPGLTLTADVGLGSLRLTQLPVPVVLTVENRGSQALAGNLEIEFRRAGVAGVRRQLRYPLSLPLASRRRWYFGLGVEDGDVVVLRLVHAGRTLWQRQVLTSSQDASFTLAMGVLGVDRTQRKLNFGPARSELNVGTGCWLPPRGTRMVATATVPSWQLPAASPPLHGLHAVVFSPEADWEEVTPEQWRALGQYLCAGGTVVVPGQLPELRRRLWAALPLPVADQPPAAVPGQALRRQTVAAGLLLSYDENLFAPVAAAGRAELADVLEVTREPGFFSYVSPYPYSYGPIPPQSARSVALLGVFCALYAAFTGPLALLFLVRQWRRAFLVYLGGTLVLFSVLAVGLGAALNHSRGDVRWMSVTELTADGGIQQSVMTLTSAGRQRHRLALSGTAPLFWHLPPLNRYNSYWGWYSDNSPLQYGAHIGFELPGDLDGSGPGAGPVPLPAWGSRQVVARDFWPGGRPLEVRVVEKPNKQFEVTVRNTLTVPLNDCKVLFGGYTARPINRGGTNTNWDSYQVVMIGQLAPGQTRTTAVTRLSLDNTVYLQQSSSFGMDPKYHPGRASAHTPRVNARGLVQGVLIAAIERSPQLQVAPCDFVANCGTHFVVQRLRADQLPPPAAVLAEAPEPTPAKPGQPAAPVPNIFQQ